MNLMDMYKEWFVPYAGQVKYRILNPGQTLATALKEGMPTQENPVGMFGIGSIGKAGRVAKRLVQEVPEEIDQTLRHVSRQKVTLPTGEQVMKMKDGTWADQTGKTIFDDTQHMYDSLKDLSMSKSQMMPDVMSSNRPSSPFYKDPFGDTFK